MTLAHGLSKYTNEKCRCVVCKAAAKEYIHERRSWANGDCIFPGCVRKNVYIQRGVCTMHRTFLEGVVTKGTRTDEELVKYGYLTSKYARGRRLKKPQ